MWKNRLALLLIFFFSIQVLYAQKWDWVKKTGNNIVGNDAPKKILPDSSGNICLVGLVKGENTFGNDEVYVQPPSHGNHDIHIQKFTPEGDLDWVRRHGGSGSDNATGLGLDKDDNDDNPQRLINDLERGLQGASPSPGQPPATTSTRPGALAVNGVDGPSDNEEEVDDLSEHVPPDVVADAVTRDDLEEEIHRKIIAGATVGEVDTNKTPEEKRKQYATYALIAVIVVAALVTLIAVFACHIRGCRRPRCGRWN